MFRNVLVGVDGTSHGRDAIALATRLAEPGARLTLVHVQAGALPGHGAELDVNASDPTYYAAGGEESDHLLRAERDATKVTADLITVAGPSIGPALHAIAAERHADLLVVGACKHSLAGRILIGDDTRATVHGATCPVGIAPDGYAADPPDDAHADLVVVDAHPHGSAHRLALGGPSLRSVQRDHHPMLVMPTDVIAHPEPGVPEPVAAEPVAPGPGVPEPGAPDVGSRPSSG